MWLKHLITHHWNAWSDKMMLICHVTHSKNGWSDQLMFICCVVHLGNGWSHHMMLRYIAHPANGWRDHWMWLKCHKGCIWNAWSDKMMLICCVVHLGNGWTHQMMLHYFAHPRNSWNDHWMWLKRLITHLLECLKW